MSLLSVSTRDSLPIVERETAGAPRPSVLAEVRDLAAAAPADRPVEPNVFYDPAWALAVSAHARGHAGAKALLAWDGAARKKQIGFLPVITAWQALKLPIPLLVAWQPYTRLTTPLLDGEAAEDAAAGLLDAAAAAGAQGLLLPDMAVDGAAAAALRRASARRGLPACVLRRHERARLDATADAETYLRQSLGAKKFKELRRQYHRLADRGAVTFAMASTPAAVAAALEDFLALEARGWKGRRGTALLAHPGDAAFIRRAAVALAAKGCFEIATLACGGVAIASGLVLRQGRRAYFFKLAYDEAEAKASPGVQLTLELTRHYCADAGIDDVDSMADADHPMIDHIWRERIVVGDLLIPTRKAGVLMFSMRILEALRHGARACIKRVVHRFRAIREGHR